MEQVTNEFDATEFSNIPDEVPAPGDNPTPDTQAKPVQQTVNKPKMPTLGGAATNNNKSFVKKEQKYFVLSKATIKLYDKPTVEPLEIDPSEFDESSKIISLAFPTESFKMSPEAEAKVITILKDFKAKGYKVRAIVDHIAAMYDKIIQIFGEDNVINVIPWPTFQTTLPAGSHVYIPTDVNIRACVFYYPKRDDGKGLQFETMSTFKQNMTATNIAALFGPKNKTPSEYVVLVDPWLGDAKEIDWTRSKFTGNLYLTAKKLGFSITNIANPEEYKDLQELLI